MKKAVCFLLLFVLISVILPFGYSRKGINKVTISPLAEEIQGLEEKWEEPDVRAVIEPYTVEEDLSNISNIMEFKEISKSDKKVLTQQLFLIKEADGIFEQPFNIYEQNAKEGIPNFITSDSALHAYHLIYDSIIKTIEKERLIDELKEFTEGSFNKALEIYNGISESNTKKAALKNIAYFGIAMKLLNISLPGGIPLEANRIIDNDVKKVKSRWSRGTSEIFPYHIDYKGYIVKGHYSREAEYGNYFLTMMWYGNTPVMFEQYDKETNSYNKMDEEIVMAIIMAAQILGDQNLSRLWEDIYSLTSVYFGKNSSISIYDMSDIIKTVYGQKLDFNKIWQKSKLQKVYELAKQKYDLDLESSIGGRIELSNEDSETNVKFRLMGQIYNLDTDIYSNLIFSKDEEDNILRQMPNGLDIPAAFGNDKAYSLVLEQIEEEELLEKYSDNMQRIRKVLSEFSNPLDYSLGNSIFWITGCLKGSYSPGYPSFMMSDEYSNKMLITSLGAISDMRHPSTLSQRQSGGKTEEVKRDKLTKIPGYVEPDINLYSRLEYMGKYIKSFLSTNGFVSTNIYDSLDGFIDMVTFLKQVSIKELENKSLTEAEKDRIEKYDEELKSVTLSVVEAKGTTREWSAIPKLDRNMACVSDVYTNGNQVLQTAVGSPDLIYVVVPYEGELYITRGSIYSYYQFIQTTSKKLKDIEWQNIVNEDRETEQEEWIREIKK